MERLWFHSRIPNWGHGFMNVSVVGKFGIILCVALLCLLLIWLFCNKSHLTPILILTERKEYKKFLAGEKSSMSGEKLAKLTNVGFVFNVKAAKAAAASVAAAASASAAENNDSRLGASSNQTDENGNNTRKRSQPQSRRMLSKVARGAGDVGGQPGPEIDPHNRDSSDEEDVGIHDDHAASLAIDHYHHQPPPPQQHQHQPQHLHMPGRSPPGMPYHNHPYGAPPTTAPWDPFNPRGRM